MVNKIIKLFPQGCSKMFFKQASLLSPRALVERSPCRTAVPNEVRDASLRSARQGRGLFWNSL